MMRPTVEEEFSSDSVHSDERSQLQDSMRQSAVPKDQPRPSESQFMFNGLSLQEQIARQSVKM